MPVARAGVLNPRDTIVRQGAARAFGAHRHDGCGLSGADPDAVRARIGRLQHQACRVDRAPAGRLELAELEGEIARERDRELQGSARPKPDETFSLKIGKVLGKRV